MTKSYRKSNQMVLRQFQDSQIKISEIESVEQILLSAIAYINCFYLLFVMVTLLPRSPWLGVLARECVAPAVERDAEQ